MTTRLALSIATYPLRVVLADRRLSLYTTRPASITLYESSDET